MCYDVSYLTKKQEVYVRRYNLDPAQVDLVFKHSPGIYHATGFSHPALPVLSGHAPHQIDLLNWGLIPFWVKNASQAVQISNKTLNARLDTLKSKPSFRSYINSRGLIMVDGFFEHHHRQGKTYPFFITRQNQQPFLLGAITSKWESKEEELSRKTVSIVTTYGNDLLAGIHNNPKLDGPRMPVIVPDDRAEEWLFSDFSDIEKFFNQPYPASGLNAFPVGKLRGKQALGNVPETHMPVDYPELTENK